MKRWLLLTWLLASCAGAERGPHETVASTDEPKRDIDGYSARIDELQRDLDATISSGASPDELAEPRGDLPIDPSSRCLVAADVRDRICDLTDRICAIAEHEGSDVQQKCTRARDACAEARARVASACGEL